MATIALPTTGGPTTAPGSDALIGLDGNAFSILGTTDRLLCRNGATADYRNAVRTEAMSGDYNHLLATCMAALDDEPTA